MRRWVLRLRNRSPASLPLSRLERAGFSIQCPLGAGRRSLRSVRVTGGGSGPEPVVFDPFYRVWEEKEGAVPSSGCQNVPVWRPGGCFQAETGALGADSVRPEVETEEPASRWLADPSGTIPYPTSKSNGLRAIGSPSLAELPVLQKKKKKKAKNFTRIANWRDRNPEFASWGISIFMPTWPSGDLNPTSQCQAFCGTLQFGDDRTLDHTILPLAATLPF